MTIMKWGLQNPMEGQFWSLELSFLPTLYLGNYGGQVPQEIYLQSAFL